mmetsp:Transcript_14146/g.23258  ORF Transcript_14146/g.23258 Transcript_14146/m.23258 type:complete len:84 (+) Transcript_14146:626-877(+)
MKRLNSSGVTFCGMGEAEATASASWSSPEGDLVPRASVKAVRHSPRWRRTFAHGLVRLAMEPAGQLAEEACAGCLCTGEHLSV